jgi:choline dehydrogenase-like flavoprotein
MDADQPGDGAHYDVVVVGGGTAGCVVAGRLADAGRRVALLEWGPSDRDEPRARYVRRWSEMVESEYDLDYRSVPQPHGNSGVRQARARILGGCCTHNTMIAFRPPAWDLAQWEALGATGWGPADFLPVYDRLRTRIEPIPPPDRNAYLSDVVTAASAALGVPVLERWNDAPWTEGAGYLEIGYHPETNLRSSPSADYVHPLLDGPSNLDLRLGSRVLRVLVDRGRASGVEIRRDDGVLEVVRARQEVVLCAGAIDTPRLLLLSGIGPAEELREAGVDVVHDLPGVGRNLQDHPETLLVWQTTRPLPPENATEWDVAVLARSDPSLPHADVQLHVPVREFTVHAEALGFPTPEHCATITPNVPRPKSRGTVRIGSPDPDAAPVYDPNYLSDPDGHDLRTLLAGLRLARRIAAAEPLRGWLARETFPGPDLPTPAADGDPTDDGALAELVRRSHNTVYHVSGSCRIGADGDPLAVLDPDLRVRGLVGLRVADASVFPTVPSINPMVTVLMVAERAAELISR